MNISNENAAASVESLTGAKGSANMLKNFGIYTADLTTGKEKTQTQIFEELAGRLTAGRGQASVEQTQASIRRGALGVTIDSTFQGDTTSAAMFKQYMVERAKAGGKGVMDFASASSTADALSPNGNVNPLTNQMIIAGKQSGAMGQAEDPYIKGINVATGALSALTDAAGGLSKALGSTSALLQTLLGNSQFKGAVNGVSSVVDFASKGISGIGNVLAGMNPMNPAPSLIQAGIIGASMGAGLGVAAGVLGATNAATYIAGSTARGAASPSMSSSISNPFSKGTTGQGAGPLSGSFSSGNNFSNIPGMDAASASAAMPGSGGGSGVVAGTAMVDIGYYGNWPVTTPYGTPDGSPRHLPHTAVDYGMPVGTPVYAVADGIVITAITGQPDNNFNSSPWSGNTVRIKHTASDGTVFHSLYGHLSEVKVSQNQQVPRGALIGLSGQTGSATGPHLHLQFEDAGQHPIPESQVAALLQGANSTTSSASSSSSSSSYSQTNLAAGLQAGANLQQMPTAAVNAFNVLQGLYSGNQAGILSSVTAIAANKGVDPSTLQNYMTSAPGSVSSATGTTGAGATPGPTNNNNVSITVQVPDVTSADALKFAQLVKGYLDNNTLMSNTGSV
jgi:murein DD-endopeptidase MepM/ murein hydrolase activator NlpD